MKATGAKGPEIKKVNKDTPVEKEILFKKEKETKNAVVFTTDELEASTIYFKKHELAELGLEGKEEFVMVIRA